MEKCTTVQLQGQVDDSYKITIGANLMQRTANELALALLGSQYAVISDSNVWELYGKRMTECLRESELNFKVITFPAGEAFKSRETKAYIEDKMLAAQLGRDCVIIAFGGGVTGDLAGFVAATYNRGIPYVQIPTSLLAQVDSSVGGKVAINVPLGKNLVGAFHQPKAVYINVNFLSTLPKRHIRTGLAETIKHAVLCDEKMFTLLEQELDAILNLEDKSMLIDMVTKSLKVKIKVVETDEYETNWRKILNYGHTVGHAIEKIMNFQMSHGEAVSIGMNVAGQIAVALGLMPQGHLSRQMTLLARAGLPCKVPETIEQDQILAAILSDKKVRKGKPEYVLPSRIGQMAQFGKSYSRPVDDWIVVEAIKKNKTAKL